MQVQQKIRQVQGTETFARHDISGFERDTYEASHGRHFDPQSLSSTLADRRAGGLKHALGASAEEILEVSSSSSRTASGSAQHFTWTIFAPLDFKSDAHMTWASSPTAVVCPRPENWRSEAQHEALGSCRGEVNPEFRVRATN